MNWRSSKKNWARSLKEGSRSCEAQDRHIDGSYGWDIVSISIGILAKDGWEFYDAWI